jgi:hypothetical protein
MVVPTVATTRVTLSSFAALLHWQAFEMLVMEMTLDVMVSPFVTNDSSMVIALSAGTVSPDTVPDTSAEPVISELASEPPHAGPTTMTQTNTLPGILIFIAPSTIWPDS